jgi:AcrR family transcriptional regulator
MIRRNTTIRKTQILEACQSIVVKYGSENVTIRRIAREVGITEGAIYRHFKSKKEVLSNLADLSINNLLKDVTDIELAGENKLEELARIFDNHILSIEKRKGASFQVIAEIISLGNKKLNKKIYNGMNQYIFELKRILSLYFDNRIEAEHIDIDAATFMLFGMMQGIVNIWTLSNYSFDLHERYLGLWKIYEATLLKH